MLIGECWSKAQPYRVQKQQFALCLDDAHRSHVIASHYLRLFQPPRSKDSPTLPDLVCSCFRLSHVQPPTCRIEQSKKQNPARCSVVLALGVSNNKTIETKVKRLVCCTTRPHSTLRGFLSFNALMPLKTVWILHKTLSHASGWAGVN